VTDEVDAAFSDMNEEEQANTLRLLARILFEAVGRIEATNVARSLFSAIGQYQGDLRAVAAELLDAIEKYAGDYTLASDDLAGAFQLAGCGRRGRCSEHEGPCVGSRRMCQRRRAAAACFAPR
jgi:hypothetical protein